MPVNRNALIRYRTIDNCLRNRQRRWTLEDLMDACSDALYEYEGIDKGVSRRSIQMDIQMMRSEKLGYNAPIIVLEKKYYTYEDADYSITNIPITDQDINKLSEVVEILRQFKGFSHFQELSGMVQRLEDKIHTAKTKQEPVIDFEKNENLKGLEHIETLYQHIIKKQTVELCYQSFKARSPNNFVFHPYYLKEYRNRWFLIGSKKRDSPIMTLALDRIITIRESSAKYFIPLNFNISKFYENVIGATVNPNGEYENVVLFADNQTAPYIITKPLHHSQKVLETSSNGIVFSIQVQLNFELEREILGFGERMKVIAPERLKARIKEQFENALDLYHFELSNSSLQSISRKLQYKGFAIINHVFGKKEVKQLKSSIYNYLKDTEQKEPHAIRNLFDKIPNLKKLVLNQNLVTILKRLNPSLFLTKAMYFDKSPAVNWYVTWHQDIIINVKEKIETSGFSGWTKKFDVHGVCPPEEFLRNTITIRIHLDDTNKANGVLNVLPGSHHKKLTATEISLITQNSNSSVCEVNEGGVQIMKPLLLHSSAKATNQKHRRVIHLEFNTMDLPNGLEWAEKLDILPSKK